MDEFVKTPAIFQDETVPSGTKLVGLSALVQKFSVQAPLRNPSCLIPAQIKGHSKQQGIWKIFDAQYEPEDTLAGHLNFAMKHDKVDLLVFKKIFEKLSVKDVTAFIKTTPRGIFTRRVWFLYEFLTEKTLPLKDLPTIVKTVDLLDPKNYIVAGRGTLSKRHRIKNNLLGDNRFCPVVQRTAAIAAFIDKDLSNKARVAIGRVNSSLIARAASFLLLADSKASFEIEGERPPRNRIERWARAVKRSGKNPLSIEELLRLHAILIEDNRFIQPGLRTESVFLGERTWDNEPIPEFIGARSEDVERLILAIIENNNYMKDAEIDPVIQAACIAFGFVYVHPFVDGNGRLHRCLIHHILSDRNFSPPEMLFPVSSVMLQWIGEYRKTLQTHSSKLMDYIDWSPTAKGNVSVNNETIDLYRFVDFTYAAEFLYKCVEQTIEKDLPREIDYLTRRDKALKNIMKTVEMPDSLAEQFILFALQNKFKLSKSRKNIFKALTDKEIADLEEIVLKSFSDFDL